MLSLCTTFFSFRFQQMQIVPVPKEFYGQFYEGDSYIILKVKLRWQPLEGVYLCGNFLLSKT